MVKNILGCFVAGFLLMLGEWGSMAAFGKDAGKEAKSQNPSISIMTYNLENLFDNEHDEGKDDYQYLPLQKKTPQVLQQCEKLSRKRYVESCKSYDWSDRALETKLGNLAKVIQVKKPDILVLQETENLAVIQKLNKDYLGGYYKEALLVEGTDKRGIDVSVLSRFESFKKPVLHNIDFSRLAISDKKPTRGILQVYLKTDQGLKIGVLGVHFPAAYHPDEQREEAFKTLNAIAEKSQGEFDVVIAAGDFNVVIDKESPFYRAMAGRLWDVSHYTGCRSCQGTHFYGRDEQWSFLDAIMLWRGSKQYRFDASSIAVVDSVSGQVNSKGQPVRYDPKAGKGFSDHLPVYAEIRTVNIRVN